MYTYTIGAVARRVSQCSDNTHCGGKARPCKSTTNIQSSIGRYRTNANVISATVYIQNGVVTVTNEYVPRRASSGEGQVARRGADGLRPGKRQVAIKGQR